MIKAVEEINSQKTMKDLKESVSKKIAEVYIT
jgi:hypothetical protein